jgi:hypothetical protein
MTEDKDRDLQDEEPTEAKEEPRPAREGRKSWRAAREARRIEARQRVRDSRALEALGQERTLTEQLGIPAFFAGLLAILVGIGWAVILQALRRWQPMLFLALGIVLLAYGVWFGLRSVARQMHGRGSLVVLVSVALTLAMLLLLIGVNALAVTHTVRVDKTAGRYLSLSKQSRDIIKKITQNVDITVVVQRNAMSFVAYDLDQVKRLLHEYEIVNDHVKWHIVDIYRDPEKARELGVSFPGKALIKCGDRREEVSLTTDNEQPMTSAIYRVTKPEKDVVYYLTGHGELKLDEFGSGQMACTRLRKALNNIQIDVKELSLKQTSPGEKPPVNVEVQGLKAEEGKAAQENIPADAKAVLILGAKVPLAPSETDALNRYLDQKQGGLFIALAFDPGAPDFSNILSRYKVTVEPGIAVDLVKALDSPVNPFVEHPQGHDVLSNVTLLEFPMSRVFKVEETPPEENPYGAPPPQNDATALVKTSGDGLVAQLQEPADKKGPARLTADKNAPRGPQTMAVLIDTKKEKPPTPPGMPPEAPEPEDTGPGNRIVVVGSYLMLVDAYQPQFPLPGTNVDFVTQTISWLAGGQAISIPERKPPQFTVGFTRLRRILVQLILVYVIPLGTIIIGIVVWWIRR